MPTFKLTIAYDGTDFVGWQRQANGTAVQELVEYALSEFDTRPVAALAAGRTDAGVHALGQVVSATIARETDPVTVVRAVNARLPPAIRVVHAEQAPAGFNARTHARRKTYRYRVWNGAVISPFECRYAWHIPEPELDINAMRDAVACLVGTHDFAAFESAESEAASSVRTLFAASIASPRTGDFAAADWSLTRPDEIRVEVTGDGFLHHMVRNIVGSLVEVGRGRYGPDWLTDVLGSRDRTRAGRTAPPQGLFLVGVSYE